MDKPVNIYKHILFRIAAESSSFFKNDGDEYLGLKKNLTELTFLENQKNTSKNDICDILFILINVFENPEDKKLLINLKRDVFNERDIPENKVIAVSKIFTEELAVKYTLYSSSKIKIQTILKEVNAVYPVLYRYDIETVKKICAKENFQKGLLLSSDILLKYARRINPDEKSVDENTVLGLWKYITRTIAKTTPFSTFTQLNIGTIADDTAHPVDAARNSAEVRSEIRYNNYILENILLLIRNHPLLFKHFNICLNSTIKETETGLIFFTNNNNIESFQTVNQNEIIRFIVAAIKENSEVTIEQLINDTLQLLDSSYSYNDVEKYLFELIQTGLLHVNLNLSGLDSEWDKSLRTFIAKYIGAESIGQQILAILNELAEKRNDYKDTPLKERELILQQIGNLFTTLLSLLQEGELKSNDYNFIKATDDAQSIFLHKLPMKSDKINLKNLVYEDSSQDLSIKVNKSQITGFVKKLDHLMRVFSCIPYEHFEKVSNYDFFKNSFKDHSEINLLAFYERLYKTKASNPEFFAYYQNYNFEKIRHANEVIQTLIVQENSRGNVKFSNNECFFDYSFTDKVTEKYKEAIAQYENASYSVFTQFYVDEKNANSLSGVLSGGMMPGRGKMISRFLHLFEDEITGDLLSWNTSEMGENEWFAENSDASFFNANLHPRIMPYEVDMPGGNTRGTGNLLNVSDLKVVFNDEAEELELRHKSGRKIIIHDLGFQNPMHRSNLYRLLNLFGNNTGYPFFNIVNNFNSAFTANVNFSETAFKITITPRITFDHTVILQRKQWQMPIQAFESIVKKSQSTTEAFIAIQKWRIALSIPDEVFIRLYRQQTNDPGQKNQDANKDDYKPQYIHFLSPLCIRTFIKTINKVAAGNLMIEEMLPTSEQQLEINEEKYATESLVQWQ